MNSFLFQIYRVVVPKPVRTIILKKKLRKQILEYYSSLPAAEINDEQKAVLKYLEDKPVTIFPYPFSNNYSTENIEVLSDKKTGMPYVIQDGKRLYFRKRWTVKRINRAYTDLLREQDPDSPHRYITEYFNPGIDDVIADIGAAEGNFALSVIDKVKKIYLLEYNREWINALKATFEPWKDKVEIIDKYVSDNNDDKHITLDSLINDHNDITMLKIDVDGNERNVLRGANKTLSGNRKLKIALCTYHQADDEAEFTLLLEKNGFRVTPSKGYMIHYYDKKLGRPWLRRGMIIAER